MKKYNLQLSQKELLLLAGVIATNNSFISDWMKIRDRKIRKIMRYKYEETHNLWLKIQRLSEK